MMLYGMFSCSKECMLSKPHNQQQQHPVLVICMAVRYVSLHAKCTNYVQQQAR